MSLRAAAIELATVWHRLPELVGPDWSSLELRLRGPLTRLCTATSDETRQAAVGELLMLLRPYKDLRSRLAIALDVTSQRNSATAATKWTKIAEAIAAAAHQHQWFNAAFAGLGPNEPLRPGQPYLLTVTVDAMSDPDAAGTAASRLERSEDAAAAEVTVEVTSPSTDVVIEALADSISVPQHGPAHEPARFLITPGSVDPLVLEVLFSRDGNFVQIMTIEVPLAEPVALRGRVRGRPIGIAHRQRPRDLSILLVEQGGKHKIMVSAAHSVQATMADTPTELADAVARARHALLDVVNTRHADLGLVYQQRVDIPDDIGQEALRRLARAGYRLYQRLFFGPTADAQLRAVGVALREQVSGESRRIQIISDRLLIPWHLMYVADEFSADAVDPTLFLGLRHTIEYIPLNAAGEATPADVEVDTEAGIGVVLALNDDIDNGGRRRLVADQVDYWSVRETSRLRSDVRRTRDEVLHVLGDPSRDDHLIYFYCHAVTQELDKGLADPTRFVFTADAALHLEDLYLEAPTRHPLPGRPLVVLNACESSRMSPLFYDGFLPYFLARRARGVIGTEVDTPALFAAEWARRFFDRLLAGESVGAAVLAIRQELLAEHGNILGLIYALYCDGDTAFRPAISGAAR